MVLRLLEAFHINQPDQSIETKSFISFRIKHRITKKYVKFVISRKNDDLLKRFLCGLSRVGSFQAINSLVLELLRQKIVFDK